MKTSRAARHSMWFLCLLLVATVSFAQTPAGTKEFEPVEGQQGKDVIWLPSAESLVEKMLDLAKVTGQDYLIDLGSGDGRTVIAAIRPASTRGKPYGCAARHLRRGDERPA